MGTITLTTAIQRNPTMDNKAPVEAWLRQIREEGYNKKGKLYQIIVAQSDNDNPQEIKVYPGRTPKFTEKDVDSKFGFSIWTFKDVTYGFIDSPEPIATDAKPPSTPLTAALPAATAPGRDYGAEVFAVDARETQGDHEAQVRGARRSYAQGPRTRARSYQERR